MNESSPQTNLPTTRPKRFRNLIRAGLNLILGTLLGLVVVEMVLRINPQLLVRGMALPAPLDPPLTKEEYDVHYSDADEIYWAPEKFFPILPEEDKLEAKVLLETDEFGFRNQPPIPAEVDIVVLGRSFSLGAQMPQPWPELVALQSDWQVLNLSEPGNSIDIKTDYLKKFGLPRQPKYVIVEVQPSIDIIGHADTTTTLVEGAVYPTIQYFGRSFVQQEIAKQNSEPIYPLQVDLPGRSVGLSCCINYLEVLSVDYETTVTSAAWAKYHQYLQDLIELADHNDIQVALLYAPMKPDIYFPLATDPIQLEPTMSGMVPLEKNQAGEIVSNPNIEPAIETLISNALVGRDVIRDFANANNLIFIDPTEKYIDAILGGEDPFMVYDSHWNEVGHLLVAKSVIEALKNEEIP